MSRINIDDQLFNDGRFQSLVAHLGDLDNAIGKSVRAFKLAQNYFLKDEKIPLSVFRGARLDALIDVGMAVICDQTHVYVHGTNEQFSWLKQRQNAGKGNANSTKRDATKKATENERNRTERERNGNGTERNVNGIERNGNGTVTERYPPTPTPTLNVTISNTSKRTKRPSDPTPGSLFFQRFQSRFVDAMGIEHLRGAEENSMCSRIVKKIPDVEKQDILLEAFFEGDEKEKNRRSGFSLPVLAKYMTSIYNNHASRKKDKETVNSFFNREPDIGVTNV